MGQELIYTSARQGLKPGSTGFCTVAMTTSMAPNMAGRLEAMSGYRYAIPPHDPKAHLNPVNFSHLTISVARREYSVLSRICNAGSDHTQRSNFLAHHVVLDPLEATIEGPAWVSAQPEFFTTAWSGGARTIDTQKKVPETARPAHPADAWRNLTGEAGWAGMLADFTLARPNLPIGLVFKEGTELLPLVEEALALLPPAKRWKITYSTYLADLLAGMSCNWRGLLADSPMVKELHRNRQSLVLDLTELGKCTPMIGGTPLGDFSFWMAGASSQGKFLASCARKGTDPWPAQPEPSGDNSPLADNKKAAPAEILELQSAPAGPGEIEQNSPVKTDLQPAVITIPARHYAGVPQTPPSRSMSGLLIPGVVLLVLLVGGGLIWHSHDTETRRVTAALAALEEKRIEDNRIAQQKLEQRNADEKQARELQTRKIREAEEIARKATAEADAARKQLADDRKAQEARDKNKQAAPLIIAKPEIIIHIPDDIVQKVDPKVDDTITLKLKNDEEVKIGQAVVGLSLRHPPPESFLIDAIERVSDDELVKLWKIIAANDRTSYIEIESIYSKNDPGRRILKIRKVAMQEIAMERLAQRGDFMVVFESGKSKALKFVHPPPKPQEKSKVFWVPLKKGLESRTAVALDEIKVDKPYLLAPADANKDTYRINKETGTLLKPFVVMFTYSKGKITVRDLHDDDQLRKDLLAACTREKSPFHIWHEGKYVQDLRFIDPEGAEYKTQSRQYLEKDIEDLKKMVNSFDAIKKECDSIEAKVNVKAAEVEKARQDRAAISEQRTKSDKKDMADWDRKFDDATKLLKKLEAEKGSLAIDLGEARKKCAGGNAEYLKWKDDIDWHERELRALNNK